MILYTQNFLCDFTLSKLIAKFANFTSHVNFRVYDNIDVTTCQYTLMQYIQRTIMISKHIKFVYTLKEFELQKLFGLHQKICFAYSVAQ